MITASGFRKLALALPGTIEQPHFHRAAFKTKRIFATLDEKAGLACLMLSEVDQSVFCAYDSKIMYPVPNKWGKKGATYVELKKVRKDLLKDALRQAYDRSFAPARSR